MMKKEQLKTTKDTKVHKRKSG